MLYPTIPINQIDNLIDQRQDIYLVDLRNRASFGRCHIKGAVNIPFQELENRLDELPSGQTLYFYCSRGGQSMLACNHLAPLGRDVVNTAGGLAFYRGKYLVRV